MTRLFDELRGAVIDLPVGTILPGWVQKSAVIEMLDRIEAEHEAPPFFETQTCGVVVCNWSGLIADFATHPHRWL